MDGTPVEAVYYAWMRADPSIAVDPTVAPSELRTGGLTDLVGSTLVGRYEVGPLLGEGAMGAVFRGRHRPLSRDVAIKVLRPEFTQHRQIAARFEREAKVVSMLSHPGIVQVFDFGPEPMSALGRPIVFIVMELLSGRELRAELGEPIEPEVALRRTVQMLEGIAHAHERGVIHRDLKPENVYLTTDADGSEQVKLVDFGIAKLLESGGPALTQMGMVFGTPAYMSPEQAIGGAIDERADLYAVGIILYEMLAGRPPFTDDDIGVLLRRQIQDEPPKIRGLHPAIQRLLDRLLAKSASERIASATEAIAAVRETMEALARPVAQHSTEIALSPTTATGESTIPDRSGPFRATTGPERRSSLTPSVAAMTRSLLDLRAMPSSRPRWFVPAAAGAAVLLLVGVIWAASGDDEPEPAEASPAVGAASPVELLQDAFRDRAPDGDIEAVDALLDAKRWSAADAKLDALVAEYPQDGRLVWRRALVLRGKGAGPTARGKVFAQALQLEPTLLREEVLRQELARELGGTKVADELVAAVAERADAPTLLLPVALRTKNALSYRPRHVVLEAVERDPVQAAKLDHAMHRSLDAWQAPEADDPCVAYRGALDAMAAKPDPGHLGTLMWAVPPSGCEDLATRQAEVRAVHEARFAGTTPTLPLDYESKRPKKKKRRRGIFGIFR